MPLTVGPQSKLAVRGIDTNSLLRAYDSLTAARRVCESMTQRGERERNLKRVCHELQRRGVLA
jgi:hypothetical protein